MTMLPPVSVVIPTYNRLQGGFLEKAIDSVLGQSYPHVELIVVDDGSTDGTAAMLKQFGDRLKVACIANQGPSTARNHGIKLASHELIAFLDSDDWWDKKKLAVQVKVMAEHPTALISHTDEVWYRRGEFLNQKKKHKRPHGEIFQMCLPLCCVGMSTVMMRRSFFELVGYFDETLPCCEDYDLWLRASGQVQFYKIDQPLTYKQGGRDDQVSVQYRVGMDQFRIQSLEKCLTLDGFSLEQQALLARELVHKATIYGKGCLKHNRPQEGQKYLDLAERWKST